MEVVDNKTGEVLNCPFRTIYQGVVPTYQDCSNKFQKRFKEVPPYAVDIETGKILNKTSEIKLVEDEPFDVDEYIQSFKGECDIYTILEKFALTGCTDTSLINKNVMSFGDISELPDNLNEMNEYFERANAFVSQFTKETGAKILDEKVSVEEIQNDITSRIQKNLESSVITEKSEGDK